MGMDSDWMNVLIFRSSSFTVSAESRISEDPRMPLLLSL
jgi:hypothetical protein